MKKAKGFPWGQFVHAVILVVCAVVLFCAPFGFLWIYASWGGDCLERGGKIVGSAFETHCEGAKR